jgi:hypothetical protein
MKAGARERKKGKDRQPPYYPLLLLCIHFSVFFFKVFEDYIWGISSFSSFLLFSLSGSFFSVFFLSSFSFFFISVFLSFYFSFSFKIILLFSITQFCYYIKKFPRSTCRSTSFL